MRPHYLLFFVVLTACLTPMTAQEIEDATTCNVSLKDAKRNLLISGYGIQSSDEDAIVTDYKQIDIARSSDLSRSIFQRLSVVKLENGRVKIVPRLKIVIRSATTDHLAKDGKNSFERTDEIESEVKYRREEIADILKTKAEVCGPLASRN